MRNQSCLGGSLEQIHDQSGHFFAALHLDGREPVGEKHDLVLAHVAPLLLVLNLELQANEVREGAHSLLSGILNDDLLDDDIFLNDFLLDDLHSFTDDLGSHLNLLRLWSGLIGLLLHGGWLLLRVELAEQVECLKVRVDFGLELGFLAKFGELLLGALGAFLLFVLDHGAVLKLLRKDAASLEQGLHEAVLEQSGGLVVLGESSLKFLLHLF